MQNDRNMKIIMTNSFLTQKWIFDQKWLMIEKTAEIFIYDVKNRYFMKMFFQIYRER